jgi:endogenous inhibitor of DNA gyrase (YacG/DUF329 family)
MDDAPLARRAPPCPICGKPAIEKFRPFCSERCSLVDLGRWLGGGYRVPTAERPEDAPAASNPETEEDGKGE